MDLATLGTFHERHGDQELLLGTGMLPQSWGRVFGQSYGIAPDATIEGLNFDLAPEFDGNIWGIQIGTDLYVSGNDGTEDRWGVFYSHSNANGDVDGNALARFHVDTGSMDVEGNSLGAYWTRLGETGWYLDAVGMYTWIGGDISSDRGIGTDIGGHAWTASIEGSYRFDLGDGWRVEPQVQLVWQRIDLGAADDRISQGQYDPFNTFAGRLGVRLEGEIDRETATFMPHVDVDVWHDFDGTETVTFASRDVSTEIADTLLEIGGGVDMQVTEKVSAYSKVGYSFSLDGDLDDALTGNLGLRVTW